MIKIQKLDPHLPTPHYAHKDDAALDLYAAESAEIPAKQKVLINLGLKIAIPSGHVGLIWDKSGLAAKNGLTVLGGVIDAGYRGEITLIIANLGDEPYHVQQYQKIAQLLIQPVTQFPIEHVDALDETDRGEGRFGSTGLYFKPAEH